jgi:hypothetical protein
MPTAFRSQQRWGVAPVAVTAGRKSVWTLRKDSSTHFSVPDRGLIGLVDHGLLYTPTSTSSSPSSSLILARWSAMSFASVRAFVVNVPCLGLKEESAELGDCKFSAYPSVEDLHGSYRSGNVKFE